MSNPSITVLMTVFNGGDYLRMAVDSVLKQSYQDFEFLIIDDYSSDNALDYVRQLNDPRVIIHRNPQNLGQTRSLNVGLQMAKGHYIARMDADDLVYPRWLEEMVSAIRSYPDAAVISPRAVVIDGQDQIKKELNTPSHPLDIILKSVFSSPINHVGCLMQRSLILAYGGYEERYKIVADYALWSTLIRGGKKVLLHPKVLVAVRIHEKSVSMVDADKRVMAEMADVIGKNISYWSNVTFQDSEIILLWRLVYVPQMLKQEELVQAVEFFEQVFVFWKSKVMPPLSHIQKFLLQQERIQILKRIWFLIKNGDFVSVRSTSDFYVSKRGMSADILFIWLLTFGSGALSFFVGIYERIMARKASHKVGLK